MPTSLTPATITAYRIGAAWWLTITPDDPAAAQLHAQIPYDCTTALAETTRLLTLIGLPGATAEQAAAAFGLANRDRSSDRLTVRTEAIAAAIDALNPPPNWPQNIAIHWQYNFGEHYSDTGDAYIQAARVGQSTTWHYATNGAQWALAGDLATANLGVTWHLTGQWTGDGTDPGPIDNWHTPADPLDPVADWPMFQQFWPLPVHRDWFKWHP